MKKDNKKRKGFSLIELIIVIAIMAIIAAIAIPNFASIRDNSKVKADKQSADVIKRTMLMLVSDETIKPAAAGQDYIITFSSDVLQAIVGDTTGTAIHNALKDVKAPQGNTKRTYTADAAPPAGTSGVGTIADGTSGNATRYIVKVDSSQNITVEAVK